MEAAESPKAARVQIGEWILDPLAHALLKGEQQRRLPKRLVLLLLTFAEAPGQTLTREQLLSRVWQRRGVGDEVLSRAIAELRLALEDDARAPRYIETLPKTGYRLLAPVRQLNNAPEKIPAATAGASTVSSGWARRWMAALALIAIIAAWALLQQPSGSTVIKWTPAALGAARPFLSESNWVRQPRFSRTGHWLVYIEQSIEDHSTRVRMVAAEGGMPVSLEVGPGQLSGPQLSPDATRLALLARVEAGCEIRLLALPGGHVRSIGECSPRHGTSLEWVDDQSLIFTRGPGAEADEGAGLVQLNLDSGEQSRLTRPRRIDVADTQPRRAGDGTIAFLRGPPQRQRVMLLAHGREQVLVESEDRVTDLAWSSDSSQLLVGSNRGGHPALLAVDVATGAVVELGARGVGSFDLSPDGSLLFEQRRYVANLRVYRPDAESRLLSASSRYDAYPALSPDGRQLAYVSNRDSNGSIWLQNIERGSERRLALPDEAAWSRPSWAPDGSALLLTRYGQTGLPEAFRMGLQDDRLQPLPGAARSGSAARLLADGALLYIDAEEGRSALWLQPPGLAPQRIADDVLEFRTDGEWIGWQLRGSAGVRIARLDTLSAPTPLLQELGAGRPAGWTLAQDELVYLALDDSGTQRLWRLALPSGKARPWLTPEHAPADPTVAVAPGFAYAILGGIERVDADLWRVPAPPPVSPR